jgi:sugar (pentulose or hexulose) kinase
VSVDCVVTLDAGTGSGRCVVFDAAGHPIASAQEPFHYRTFNDPAMPLVRGFDLDPDEFWGALARCATAAMAQLPADARVRGVVATSQREGCVFLDADGEVLYAGPNLDARAAIEGLELQQHMTSDALHAITGHAPPYIFPLARWHWFKKHHDAGRVATLLMLNDWIAWKLCGSRACEHSNAGESMLYDVARRAWSEEILNTLDVPAAILPPLCEAGSPLGVVSAAAAAATGIPDGTPVFAGGADTESALLGSGAHRPGQLGAVLGTTSPVQLVTDAPIVDAAGTLWTSCHVVADRWVLESNAGDTGSAYRWLLDLLFGGHDAAAHAAAERAMAPFDGGPRPMFCHLGPGVFDLRNMNPFQPAGVLFRFPLLHIDRPDRGELLRAFVENVAYAIRGNVDQILAVAGTDPGPILVSGGLTQSPTVLRVLATTLARPLEVARVPESASLGCAILGAVGAGIHPSIADAVAAMTSAFTVDPDEALAPAFDAGYRRWREMSATLQTWSLA